MQPSIACGPFDCHAQRLREECGISGRAEPSSVPQIDGSNGEALCQEYPIHALSAEAACRCSRQLAESEEQISSQLSCGTI